MWIVTHSIKIVLPVSAELPIAMTDRSSVVHCKGHEEVCHSPLNVTALVHECSSLVENAPS